MSLTDTEQLFGQQEWLTIDNSGYRSETLRSHRGFVPQVCSIPAYSLLTTCVHHMDICKHTRMYQKEAADAP